MPLDFIFAEGEQTDKQNLLQGDLLLKTASLSAAIQEAHSNFANTESYSHLMVLTQSCDLVRRNGKIKSDYIVVAAVRPLNELLTKKIYQRNVTPSGVPIPVFPADQESPIRELLERLLHNTVDNFFFMPQGSHPAIDTHLCAFLQLSVVLKVEHYQHCLAAKIAQLSDVFQAKVGWLSGNIYSRVGTPDIEEHVSNPDEFKANFFDEVLFSDSAWLTSDQLREFRRRLKTWEQLNPNVQLPLDEARNLIAGLPDQREILVSRIIDVLVSEGIVQGDPETRARASNKLRNDDAILKMARAVR